MFNFDVLKIIFIVFSGIFLFWLIFKKMDKEFKSPAAIFSAIFIWIFINYRLLGKSLINDSFVTKYQTDPNLLFSGFSFLSIIFISCFVRGGRFFERVLWVKMAYFSIILILVLLMLFFPDLSIPIFQYTLTLWLLLFLFNKL